MSGVQGFIVTLRGTLAAIVLLTGVFISNTAGAELIPFARAKQLCTSGYAGPTTRSIPSATEAANLKIMYAWSCLALIEGTPRQAFGLYVAKDFCDHSTRITLGLKKCAGYDETEQMFIQRGIQLHPDGTIEFPVVSTVKGDIIRQYGGGVNVWRVHNGKITDHWTGATEAEEAKIKPSPTQ